MFPLKKEILSLLGRKQLSKTKPNQSVLQKWKSVLHVFLQKQPVPASVTHLYSMDLESSLSPTGAITVFNSEALGKCW